MSPRSLSGFIERQGSPKLRWSGQRPAAEPKAVLLMVHGLAEHIGRYDAMAEHFTELGFCFLGIDLRGHGLSEGRRVHVNHFGEYVADVESLLSLADDRFPGRPRFLVGHSMGGVVSILAAGEHGERLDGLVLSSPGLAAHPDSAPPGWLLAIGRAASVLAPPLLFSAGLDPSWVSRDPQVVEAYVQDPLVSSKVSARWVTEFLAAQNRCFEQVDALRLPVLLMQAGADRLVDPETSERWAQRVADCQYRSWPGLFHEIFNEPERLQVFRTLSRWLDDRLGG